MFDNKITMLNKIHMYVYANKFYLDKKKSQNKLIHFLHVLVRRNFRLLLLLMMIDRAKKNNRNIYIHKQHSSMSRKLT